MQKKDLKGLIKKLKLKGNMIHEKIVQEYLLTLSLEKELKSKRSWQEEGGKESDKEGGGEEDEQE